MQNLARFQIDDTIAALSSAAGPGLRHIVRISGPDAWKLVRSLLPESVPLAPEHRAVYETFFQGVKNWAPIPVLVLVFCNPRSYTGQDLVEIHLPGNPVLAQTVLETLLERGARAALPGEFTLRAFLAGKMDLTRAEALLAILHADRPDSLNEALQQFAGNIANPLLLVKERLLDLLADLEASLDFPEEDLLFAAHETLISQCCKARETITEVLERIQLRGTVQELFRVVLAGRPNAGKSSLFNALLGEEAALVSPNAGTTRDYLTAYRRLKDLTIELVDTAGTESIPVFANPDQQTPVFNQLQIAAQAQTLRVEQLRRADLVLYCLPVNEPLTPEDERILQELPSQRFILVGTKADLVEPTERSKLWSDAWSCSPIVFTSALRGEGIGELEEMIRSYAQLHRRTDPLAISLGRCQHHLNRIREALGHAETLLRAQEAPELIAVELRTALDELGAVLGEVYSEDLLDRIFSRFCIGK